MINFTKRFRLGRILASILLASVLLPSCQEDVTNYTVGENFLDDPSSVVLIDTISIEAETYMLDSIVTSGTSKIVVGRLKDDPNFGTTDVESRFHVYISNPPIPDESAAPDSMVLELYYDGYYHGDTLETQEINVYKLARYDEPDDLFGEDTQNFYNIHPIDYDENDLLGTISFKPLPLNQNLEPFEYLKFSKEFTQQMWDSIYFDAEDLELESDFLDFILPGLVLTPGTNSTQLTGFSAQSDDQGSTEAATMAPRLIMYYHDKDNEELQIEFDMTRPQYQYNYFKPDYSNTHLAALNTDRDAEFNSEITDDEMYMQGGNGVAVKLDFGNIFKLGELGLGMVTYAELIIHPKDGTYVIDDEKLPTTLDAFVLDHRGDIISPLTDLSGQQQIKAYLYSGRGSQSPEDEDENYYSLDVTSYIRSEFLALEDTEQKLALHIPTTDNSNATTLDQVVFDSQFGEDEMELRLYYVITE